MRKNLFAKLIWILVHIVNAYRKNTITSRSNFSPYLSDLFKEYIILENTSYSVLNLNKLMSRCILLIYVSKIYYLFTQEILFT